MRGFFDLFSADDDQRSNEKTAESASFWDLFSETGEAVEVPELRQAPSLCCQQFDPSAVFWAMRNLPIGEATKHFMVCGVTGSGKTTAIQLFLNSIAPRFSRTEGEPEQLIIFDAKCEIIPVLSDMGYGPEDDNVWILNPFDERAAVWPFADSVQEAAEHILKLLFLDWSA